jgi:hypothetical protein
MWTIFQVAERDGVSKPTVSIRVKRFVEQHDLTVERDSQGRVARLNVAEYDALRGRYDDPSKAQAPQKQTQAPNNESYDEALRQKTWIETESRRIALDTLKGRLIETASVVEGYDRTVGIVLDVIARIEDHADDLAAVVTKEGARGLAPALKKLGAVLLKEIAEVLLGEAKTLRQTVVDEVPQNPQ